LAQELDRNDDTITALGFLSDYVVTFKRNRTYITTGEPVDNTLTSGGNIFTQIAMSDVGCICPNSVVQVGKGLLFASEAGIRLLSMSGEVVPIGAAVDPRFTYINSAVLNTVDRNVRFYQDTDALVLDYESGNWSTWSIGAVSACSGHLVNSTRLYTEADGIYTDDGANYTHRVKTAHMGGTLGGFQRVRRVGGIGESDTNYTITVNLYHNGSETPSETFSWNSGDDLNTDTWGSGTWGSGSWGDTSTTTTGFIRDSIWRWRRRVSRQKCSSLSVEVVYTGSGKGPVHTAILFEVGTKQGIDRMNRTFTQE
jgi:hypothetical protein